MQPRQPRKESSTVHLRASVVAAAAEIMVFHPVDTSIKRLQVNQAPIYNAQLALSANLQQAKNVIFQESAQQNVLHKTSSLYRGIGWASVYKVFQRGYKFTAQPLLESALEQRLGATYFGDHSKWLMAGISGSIAGVGEVVLLPLDIWKIRAQAGEKTKPTNLSSTTTKSAPAKNTADLYKGLGITSARNGIGSFALFSVPEAVLHNGFDVTKRDASTSQKLFSEIAGSASSIAISSPLDVIKTRTQAKTGAATESAFKAATNIIRTEGYSAFYKGITPKLAGQGAKLTFFLRIKNAIVEHLSPEQDTKTKPITKPRAHSSRQ